MVKPHLPPDNADSVDCGPLREPTPAGDPHGQERVDWSGRFRERAAAARDPRLQAFYGQLPVTGDTPIREAPMLALDIETSGLDPEQDAIVSIGFLSFDHRRIRCAGARNWIVRPMPAPQKTAASIHGITHSVLTAARPLTEYVDALLEAMAGRIIVAHCGSIERRFLQTASMALTGEALVFPLIDTMRLENAQCLRTPAERVLRWFFRRPQPSLRLDAVRRRYGLPPYRPHHALTDALATAELLQAQLQAHYTPQTPVARLWC